MPERSRLRVKIQPRPKPAVKSQPVAKTRSAVTRVRPPVQPRIVTQEPVAKARFFKEPVVPQQPRLPEPTVPVAQPVKTRVAAPRVHALPVPAEPTQTATPTVPGPPAPEQQPAPIPSRATPGVIPERAAVPKTSFPNANIRKTLSRLGSKTSIELRLKIYPDGHIDLEIVASSGEPELDRVVLQDLQGWRWEPARSAGRPVYSEKNLRLKLEAD